jgi:RimJ/RimL family protein N-acetyltransferase
MAPFELRALIDADESAYNDFLARGVAEHPTLFRIDAGDFRERPFPTAASDDGCTVLAHDGARWLGVGTIEREQGRVRRRHIAWIVRMLVASPGAGIGRAVLRELKQRAAAIPGVEKVNLTVAAHNAAAVHLYASEGFLPFSREPDAFRVGDERVEELSMSHRLRP